MEIEPPKRKRGCPKGTAFYIDGDRKALSQFADMEVEFGPGFWLAAFLRKKGFRESEHRRLQKRWLELKEPLLRDAQERRSRLRFTAAVADAAIRHFNKTGPA